jgi:hypothetical protein
MGTSPPSKDREAGLGQKQGPFRIAIQQHMHAPLMAIPMGAGEKSLWHQGEATDRTIAQQEERHGSGQQGKPITPWAGGPVQGSGARDQKIQSIMGSGQAISSMLARLNWQVPCPYPANEHHRDQ